MSSILKKEAQVTLLSETDLHGKILFANDAFCEVSRYSREDLVGRPHSIIRHPDMPKELFAFMWAKISKGDTFRGVIKNRASDNSHYWVNATIMPLKGPNNEIGKYVGVRHLITDEMFAQELYDFQVKALRL